MPENRKYSRKYKPANQREAPCDNAPKSLVSWRRVRRRTLLASCCCECHFMTANDVVLFWFPVWAILIQGKCMTKPMKGCIRNNPAFAATILENVQALKLWTRIRKSYCAFHKHANSKVQKTPSHLCFSLPSIIITTQATNLETQKHTKRIEIHKSQITNYHLLNPLK